MGGIYITEKVDLVDKLSELLENNASYLKKQWVREMTGIGG